MGNCWSCWEECRGAPAHPPRGCSDGIAGPQAWRVQMLSVVPLVSTFHLKSEQETCQSTRLQIRRLRSPLVCSSAVSPIQVFFTLAIVYSFLISRSSFWVSSIFRLFTRVCGFFYPFKNFYKFCNSRLKSLFK